MDYAANSNLYARFRANWDPAAPFVIAPDGVEHSYGEAEDLAARVAGCLAAAGVRAGDRVSVLAGKSVDYLWVYLGCVRGGHVFHPLNPSYTDAELSFFLSDAEPALVICDDGAVAARIAAMAPDLQIRCIGDAGDCERLDYRAAAPPAAVAPVAGTEPAALLYSSGTTGRPKGIVLSHDNLWSNAAALSAAWGFNRADVLLHALPLFHVHGLFIALGCTLHSGSALYFLPRFDAGPVLDALPACTVMMGVPTYYTRLLAEPGLTRERCAAIRLFTCGSAPLREDTFHAFSERTGQVILERYGMTETGILCSNPLAGERRAGTVGPPLPGVEVRIVDDAGTAVAPGAVGGIEVRGANVFGGYWRAPDKTAQDFSPGGWFKTGDEGLFERDGYVRIVGRSKDLVITGGMNVYPVEVETVLNAQDGVFESAVIGVPHPDLGEAVVAVVVMDPAAPVDGAAAALAASRGELAGYKLPKRIVTVDALPRNVMGKVQKNVLRDDFNGLFETLTPG